MLLLITMIKYTWLQTARQGHEQGDPPSAADSSATSHKEEKSCKVDLKAAFPDVILQMLLAS